MSDLTDDQHVRLQCLDLCKGVVSEAKQAYFWVMGEQTQAAKQAAAQLRVMNQANPYANSNLQAGANQFTSDGQRPR